MLFAVSETRRDAVSLVCHLVLLLDWLLTVLTEAAAE